MSVQVGPEVPLFIQMVLYIDYIKAILLGVIEGLTEFIPVSSTAHLLIGSKLLDFYLIQNNFFEIIIQSGAILAICVLYNRRIFDLIFHINQKEQQKFIINIIIAFLPAAIIGLILHSIIKSYFFNEFIIATTLILGGIIMIIVEKNHIDSQKIDNFNKITPKIAFKIGLFQSIAMIPGVSRSGATIIGSMISGLNRKIATEFSFFLAIPTIFGATIYDLYKNYEYINIDNYRLILIGLLASFISSLIVIKWLINYVSSNKFTPFAIYRIFVGIILFLIIL